MMWRWSTALRFVRRMQRTLEPLGYHVALAGGVLMRGHSRKDLDLVIIPHDLSRPPDVGPASKVVRALEKLGLRCYCNAHKMRAGWRLSGSTDIKVVDAWRDRQGRRVDLIWAWHDPLPESLYTRRGR